MDPYFQNENVVIYHGDCQEVMLNIPLVDVVLTDPPYDLGRLEKQQFHSLFRAVASGDLIVFCPPENQWEFDGLTRRLFWCKPTSTKNYSKNYGRFVEMISVFKRNDVWNSELNWANYTGVYSDVLETGRVHEYQKPTSLISRFIRIHSLPGQIILDPFMGSGTTLHSATATGRRAIGIDIDERNCEIAAKKYATNGMEK